jgi:hypothetical protein
MAQTYCGKRHSKHSAHLQPSSSECMHALIHLFCKDGAWIHGLMHARQALYLWVISPAPLWYLYWILSRLSGIKKKTDYIA